jgi:hypothetical protein
MQKNLVLLIIAHPPSIYRIHLRYLSRRPHFHNRIIFKLSSVRIRQARRDPVRFRGGPDYTLRGSCRSRLSSLTPQNHLVSEPSPCPVSMR